MSRPTKSVDVINKHLTKEEAEIRRDTENLLKGNNNKVKPLDYLTLDQIKIFKYIVTELKASGIIGNLDIYLLNKCAVAIDRLNKIEEMINQDSSLLMNTDLLKARKDYTSDFNKCCAELCLSPQARAKIGTLNLKKKEEDSDPLLKVLRGGK